MKLTIVRHAESTGNAQGRWQGRDDTLLTDFGRGQAHRLRERFLAEGYVPTHLYSSPLSRTFETARIASGGWEIPIAPWDDLMETDVGVFTGLTWEEVESRYPEIAREFAVTRNLDLIEGAETFAQRTARAQRVVDRIVNDHSNDDRVIAFAHGGIIQNIFARIVGSDRLWGLNVRNTALFEFTLDVEQWYADGPSLSNVNMWRISKFNDASHLD